LLSATIGLLSLSLSLDERLLSRPASAAKAPGLTVSSAATSFLRGEEALTSCLLKGQQSVMKSVYESSKESEQAKGVEVKRERRINRVQSLDGWLIRSRLRVQILR
jgi:hypothetical protein